MPDNTDCWALGVLLLEDDAADVADDFFRDVVVVVVVVVAVFADDVGWADFFAADELRFDFVLRLVPSFSPAPTTLSTDSINSTHFL